MPAPELTYTMMAEVDSTNSFCNRKRAAGAIAPHTVVVARTQTAGRGQRGNTWHSQPGKNLLFSIYLEPQNIDVKRSFAISQAVALAIVDAIRPMLGKVPDIAVKWPNDIYVGDCKIAGILIENAFAGSKVANTVIGVGLNVNQTEFPDWVPNPTSMALLSETEFCLPTVLKRVAQAIVERIEMHDADFGTLRDLRDAYISSLWRHEGMHPYTDIATGTRFEAMVADVHPTGHLELLDSEGRTRTYAFKEVIQELV